MKWPWSKKEREETALVPYQEDMPYYELELPLLEEEIERTRQRRETEEQLARGWRSARVGTEPRKFIKREDTPEMDISYFADPSRFTGVYKNFLTKFYEAPTAEDKKRVFLQAVRAKRAVGHRTEYATKLLLRVLKEHGLIADGGIEDV